METTKQKVGRPKKTRPSELKRDTMETLFDKLEVKDRQYYLVSDATPITYQIRSKNTRHNPLQFFDGQMSRAIRYATNQTSLFEDEQEGEVLLGTVVFEDGTLFVKKENRLLQLLLSILHPDKGVVFDELDPEAEAEEDIDEIKLKVEAQAMAFDMEIEDLEAIGRVVLRSGVDKLSSKELRRDMAIWAGSNAKEFIELSQDTDIKLRNLALRAMDFGLIGVRDDNTTLYWTDTDKVICKLPFGTRPAVGLANYFKTDEGIDVVEALSLKLS
jgi:hypothetical protein